MLALRERDKSTKRGSGETAMAQDDQPMNEIEQILDREGLNAPRELRLTEIKSTNGPAYSCPVHGDIGNATVWHRFIDSTGKIQDSPKLCIVCLFDLAKRFCAHT